MLKVSNFFLFFIFSYANPYRVYFRLTLQKYKYLLSFQTFSSFCAYCNMFFCSFTLSLQKI